MKRLLKRLAFLVFALLVLILVGGGFLLRWHIRASLPVLDGNIQTEGISAPVEVLRDAHGVPHIRAHSIADALFAQGYVTAQDRLWQMDMSRRKAEGRLSEILARALCASISKAAPWAFPRWRKELWLNSRRMSACCLPPTPAASMLSSRATRTAFPWNS